MVTLAQRIEELRTAKGLSRPALAAALGFPRTAIEKFETGRQTPTQDQQNKLASYFGVSLFYLRGETNDTTQMSDWMDGAFLDEPAPAPAPKRAVKPVAAASSGGEGGTMFDAFLTSKKFQEHCGRRCWTPSARRRARRSWPRPSAGSWPAGRSKAGRRTEQRRGRTLPRRFCITSS